MSFVGGLGGSRNVQVTVGDKPDSPRASTSLPIATYRSNVDGKMHSVEIRSLSDPITPSDLGAVRASLQRDFGTAAATHALRLVQGLPEGEKVTGKHVVDANLAALEFVAPGLRLAGDKARAEDKLTAARGELTAAKQNLAKLEREQGELRTQNLEVRDNGGWSPHLSSRLTGVADDIALAKSTRDQKQASVDGCEEALMQATEAADKFLSSLETPLALGDDLTRLSERVSKLADERDAALMSFDTAKAAHMRCKATFDSEMKDHYQDLSFKFPSKDFQLARQRLNDASEVLSSRGERLADLTSSLEAAQGQLDALRFGPVSRNLQVALDHVGADDRFLAIMSDLAPGKTTGGALGTAEKYMAKLSPTEILPSLVKTVVVPLGFADSFRLAIKAEDCERRLTAASKSMDDHPVAKALTTSLASSKEAEKFRHGIEGTIAFVSFALTAPGGSALGTLTQPATSAIQHAISGSVNAAVGSLTGGLQGTMLSGLQPLASNFVTEKIASLPSMGVSTGGSKLGQRVIEKLGGVGTEGATEDQQREMLKSFEPPPGTSVPTIPVRSVGVGPEATTQLSLGDPEVMVAFLTYLGPKADSVRLNNPGQREAELRRVEIRSGFFGAKDGEDFRVGTSVRDGKTVIEALDGGVSAPRVPERVSPLQLLMTGVGLIS